MSIGAFEHFGLDRYDDFFKMAYTSLPNDAKMLLHTIVKPSAEQMEERQLGLTMRLLRFVKFIMDEIFPGGQLPYVAQVEEHATKAGFEISRIQPLRLHYARTLEIWGARLRPARTRPSPSSPKRSTSGTKYLTGCADLFRQGYTDVCQFRTGKSSQARSLRTDAAIASTTAAGSSSATNVLAPGTSTIRVREQRGQPPAERGREGAVALTPDHGDRFREPGSRVATSVRSVRSTCRSSVARSRRMRSRCGTAPTTMPSARGPA